MNNNIQEQTKWSENVILVDADYVDKVAFNLIVNFERMLGRRIPQADMAHWLDCVALDGGIRQGDHEIFVALIHDKGKAAMENFKPGLYADLNEKAFKDQLGEFTISAYPKETIADSDDFFSEALQLIVAQKDVKRVMVIPNAEESSIYNKVREVLHRVDDDNKRITVFAMEPKPGGNFHQEILGYSLLAALGISSDEINSKS
jgi:hypothetical protein